MEEKKIFLVHLNQCLKTAKGKVASDRHTKSTATDEHLTPESRHLSWLLLFALAKLAKTGQRNLKNFKLPRP